MDFYNQFVKSLPKNPAILALDASMKGLALPDRYHGIDASKVSIRLSPKDLKRTLEKMEARLRPGGFVYLILQYGKGEGAYNMNTISLAVSKPLVLEMHQTGISEDGMFHMILKKGEKKSGLL